MDFIRQSLGNRAVHRPSNNTAPNPSSQPSGSRTTPTPTPHRRFTRRRRIMSGQPILSDDRPSFMTWAKHIYKDIITMAIMGALGLGIYMAPPAASRSFPVVHADGEVVNPDIAYPLRHEIVPIWLAALLASIIPIIVMVVMQIRVRSFWDLNNGIVGLLYSLLCASLFQVMIKCLIGGLRPHFLAVCRPDLSLAVNRNLSYLNAAGYTGIYYTREVCTGDRKEINDSLESMPSGHSTAAFAGFVYLYLYLNGKLKIFANYHASLWKLAVLYAPILSACLIAGAMTIDAYHHWYDVLVGGIIGTVMAFSAYRTCYAAIWDWRWNHVPLRRNTPYRYDPWGADLTHATATRKAGWDFNKKRVRISEPIPTTTTTDTPRSPPDPQQLSTPAPDMSSTSPTSPVRLGRRPVGFPRFGRMREADDDIV